MISDADSTGGASRPPKLTTTGPAGGEEGSISNLGGPEGVSPGAEVGGSGLATSSVAVESLFVRGRHCLLARGDFRGLFGAWEAHLQHHQPAHDPAAAGRLRAALAAFTLHCASHPRNEHIGWTLNFQQPPLNLFLVGDTGDSTVAGRYFTENVKVAAEQSFYQELVPRNRTPLQSHIFFEGNDPLLAAEQFYERSEQRPARFFQLSEHRFAILSAHPDWDEAWFRSVDLADVIDLDQREELSLLETRLYRWGCGCSSEKLLRVIAPMLTPTIDALFEGDESLTANCPRCGARYILTREAAEAYLAQHAATE